MNGILVLDKPLGKTSHDMVSLLRRLTRIRRIGHTGTLDPEATGVLPVCIGIATKAADLLTFSDKKYRAELVLGMTTDTLDAEGEVLTECPVHCTEEEIRRAVMSFTGEIEQVPPMYSAIKQNGKKLYELARKGITVERKKRKVQILSIDILKIEDVRVTMDVHCSKGTYIRTLCEDIGLRLGVGAYMNRLQRRGTGRFTIEEAHSVQEICRRAEEGTLEELLVPVDCLFEQAPALTVNETQKQRVVNGARLPWAGLEEGQTYRVYDGQQKFLCLSRFEDGVLRLEKAFWQGG